MALAEVGFSLLLSVLGFCSNAAAIVKRLEGHVPVCSGGGNQETDGPVIACWECPLLTDLAWGSLCFGDPLGMSVRDKGRVFLCNIERLEEISSSRKFMGAEMETKTGSQRLGPAATTLQLQTEEEKWVQEGNNERTCGLGQRLVLLGDL